MRTYLATLTMLIVGDIDTKEQVRQRLEEQLQLGVGSFSRPRKRFG